MVLSRQLLNGTQDFFSNISIIIYFFKYETIETHARAFLPLNISAVGRVKLEILRKRNSPEGHVEKISRIMETHDAVHVEKEDRFCSSFIL